jgi:hypothetical protein
MYHELGEEECIYDICKILVGKPEGKRLLGRPRCKWVDNIKLDHRVTGWDAMGWTDVAQDRDHL